MSFFRNIFSPVHAESLVLIDISAGSVAGAYASYTEGEAPSLLYTRRLPIEVRKDEPHELAMLRALEILGEALIREGAPTLTRATGSGRANTILVSVDAPWQETRVRTEHFERETPFTFTKRMVATVLEKTSVIAEDKVLADESITGTILNGYETREPYGKKTRRASIVILTSLIDKKISMGIAEILRKLFHTKNILSIAGSSLRYQAMRTAFPHERDALILDAIGPLVSVALVRKDLLVAVIELADAVRTDVDSWVQKVASEFTELAKEYPLPRTIFLLAQEQDSSSLEQTLHDAKLGELWLSNTPPKIVPVRAGHITGLVRQVTTSPPDLTLLLMTLYWQHHLT
ncbi:MAG: hypothetical protein Q7R58_01360 [bacterium]|nr:hypothetical protein [bacterium]